MKKKTVYFEIKEKMVELIKQGIYEVDEKLPSEMEMSKKFGVQRMTWRAALELLKDEGYIKVKRGVGTFVTRPFPKISDNLQELRTLTEMIKEAGLKEEHSKIVIYEEKANEEVAERLEISTDDNVLVIKMTRQANDEPIVISIDYLPEAIGKKIDKSNYCGSLFRDLEGQADVYITRSNTEIGVAPSKDKNTNKLKVRSETPIIILKQIFYDDKNYPVLYSIDYLRNDIFRFEISRVK